MEALNILLYKLQHLFYMFSYPHPLIVAEVHRPSRDLVRLAVNDAHRLPRRNAPLPLLRRKVLHLHLNIFTSRLQRLPSLIQHTHRHSRGKLQIGLHNPRPLARVLGELLDDVHVCGP